MKIELNKKLYKTLLTIMYCGEWVLNSHKTKEDKLYKETDEVEQLIFSLAKEAGVENWIVFDEDMKKYSPTAAMEEELHKFIHHYNKIKGK